MSEKTRLEGKVVSVSLTEGRDLDSELPIINFSIKDNSGKEETNSMSMNVGDGQLLRGALMGQTVVYEREEKHSWIYLYITKTFSITSGQCKGVKYTQTEEF